MQICSWSTTEVIYSTKAIRRSSERWSACLERWRWNTWRVSICRGAWETASNAVRIRKTTLKLKQISKDLPQAAEQTESQREKGKHMTSWSVCIRFRFTGEMRLKMSLCDRFWWQQMMKRTRAIYPRYLMLSIGYMAENIRFWQKATTAETAAWSETYQGVTMNIYHLLVHLHSIWSRPEIRQGCFVWSLFLFCLRLNRHLVAIPDTQLLKIWWIKIF